MPRIRRIVIALFLFTCSCAVSAAATPPSADQAFQLKVTRDDSGSGLTLIWSIGPGSYLYRAMIAAKNAVAPEYPLTIDTPSGEPKDDPDFGPQEIYRNTAAATIKLADLKNLHEIEITYQGCAEQFQLCYPPVIKTIDLQTLAIKDRKDADAATNTSSAFADAPDYSSGSPDSGTPPTPSGASTDDVSYWVTIGGMLATFFGFGLLLSLSPCTFPMVPIFFGLLARTEGSPSAMRGFGLASVFVGASATAYATLGAFSAWSGSGENLQILLQTPLALGLMSAILLVFALSMFGLFEIQLPARLVERISGNASSSGRGPVTAAMALGFGSALIAGPCVTPPLASALLYVAKTGEVAKGMAALFVFGVGMGVPLLVFGALGPRFLPKPGAWLIRVRELFGFVMIGLAIWMISRVLPETLTLQLWGLLAIVIAIYSVLRLLKSYGTQRFAWMGSASIALVVGSIAILGTFGDRAIPTSRMLDRLGLLYFRSTSEPTVVRSMDGLTRELAAARSDGKPVMVDFVADWCVECRLMDAVLRRPDVQQHLAALKLVRADVTAVDANSRALMQRFEIVGPPTILLFKPEDASTPTIKIVGAVDAATLIAKLSTVAAAN